MMTIRARFHWKNYDVLHGRWYRTSPKRISCVYDLTRELGDHVNEDELKAMIDEFDLDGDGEGTLL
jgi:hypothetical protein